MSANHHYDNSVNNIMKKLENAHNNTALMLSNLARCQERFKNIDETMRPLQATTKSYTLAKDNITLTLEEVEKTYEYFRVSSQMESTILLGFNEKNKEAFLYSIGRLSSAKTFFESNRKEIKSSGSALIAINKLLQTAITMICDELTILLNSLGNTIHYVDETFIVNSTPISLNISHKIQEIIEVLESNKSKSHYDVYKRVRTAQVKADLKAHENLYAVEWANNFAHLNESNRVMQTSASISSQLVSIDLRIDLDLPIGVDGAESSTSKRRASMSTPEKLYTYHKGIQPFKEYCQLANELLRGELQLWGNTLPTSEESLLVFVSICDAIIMEFLTLLSPILSKDTSKKSPENRILKHSQSFLIKMEMLDILMDKFDDIRDLCRPDLRHESSASANLTKLRNKLVESCINSIEILLENSLDNSDKLLDDTCDLHALTGNVLHCCKEFVSSSHLYKRMYELAIQMNLAFPPNITSLNDLRSALLDNLYTSIDNKSNRFNLSSVSEPADRVLNVQKTRLYKIKEKDGEDTLLYARKNLFLINNLYSMGMYFKEEIQQAEIQNNSVKGTTNVIVTKKNIKLSEIIESRIVIERDNFCKIIKAAMAMSKEENKKFSSLYEKDKNDRLIKAKFALFNSGMECLLAQQGEWRVFVSVLRDQLSSQLMESIIPSYTEFYNTYSIINFSKKHLEQYLRFTPEDCERILKNFFGGLQVTNYENDDTAAL